MKDYIKFMRPKHYVKNVLVFATLIFGGRFFELSAFLTTLYGTLIFCLTSSVIYILNDIKDAPNDRKHAKKKNRPLASGKISIKQAYMFACFLTIIIIIASLFTIKNIMALSLLVAYSVLNLAYSYKLKDIPIFDLLILMSGFLIRVFFGSLLIAQPVSQLLYLTVMSASFYMASGKRRNELLKHKESAGEIRSVLSHYNSNFLDKNMYSWMTITMVFYTFWVLGSEDMFVSSEISLIWTVPIVAVILMRYNLITETADSADPVEIFMNDKVLLFSFAFYALFVAFLLYAKLFINIIS